MCLPFPECLFDESQSCENWFRNLWMMKFLDSSPISISLSVLMVVTKLILVWQCVTFSQLTWNHPVTLSRCHALRDGAMTSQLSQAKLNLDQFTDGISGLCSLQIEDQCSRRVPVSRPCRHDVPWCHVVSMKCCQQGFRLSLQIGRCDGETCSHVTQDLIGGREPKMLGIWASFGE